MDELFTPKAKKMWRAIPGRTQLQLINKVYCHYCTCEAPMEDVSGHVEAGRLMLSGCCRKCGHNVAWHVEGE